MSKTALFGLTADPPGLHHRLIAEELATQFDEVIVLPCGPRPDKKTANDIPVIHRAAMTDMTFRGIPRVTVDLTDLEERVFTPTIDLYDRYDNNDTWIVVGTDIIMGGGEGESQIQKLWRRGNELWKRAKFAVTVRAGYELHKEDLPPHHMVIRPAHVDAKHFSGSSTQIRMQAFQHKLFDDLVIPEVARYIDRYALYHGMRPSRQSGLMPLRRKYCYVVFDDYGTNHTAENLAEAFNPFSRPLDESDIILVIGGDGTMLRAIRKYWRERKPFVGINAGHIGFLLNDLNDSGFTPGIFFSEQVRIRHAPLLYVEGTKPNGDVVKAIAFTDCFTLGMNRGQTIWSRVIVDDEVKVSQLVGDGVIIATPAGSTAYARSAGASPIRMDTDQLVVAGNNVFTPAWKSACESNESTIEVTVLEHERRPTELFVDGESLGEVTSFTVRKSNIAAAELGFTAKHDINRKLSRIQYPD